MFSKYAQQDREALLALRQIIFDVAVEESVGPLEESLKWGQPSYLASKPKTGTTIRIDVDSTHGGDIALYVNCKSSLIEEWRERFPDYRFGGNRSVHLRREDDFSAPELKIMIADALTYHRRKRAQGPAQS